MELLSPVGSYQNLYAAVNNGCNAVYLGGKNFNARSSADNFSENDISEIIDYCHLRGVKVFITVNTLYKNSELNDVFDFISSAYKYGADAFIFQDIGTAMHIKKIFPDVAIHASTQMTAYSLEDVLFLEELGFDRVVLSRELSIDKIKNINDNCNVETEIFVHGALCVCFSGQCLMSSHLGGRSGNRGNCAQPCRLPYDLLEGKKLIKKGYLLSPKDIMAIDMLDEIVKAGVASIKIEGRMKNAEYVAITTKAYREKLDNIETEVSTDNKKELLSVFNRGGSFSSGYLDKHSTKEMMSTETPKSTGILTGRVLKYDKKTGFVEIQTRENLIPGDGIEIWTREEPHVGTNISKPSKAGHNVTINISRHDKSIPAPQNINPGDLVYKSYNKKVFDYAKSLYVKDQRTINISGSIYAKISEDIKLSLNYNGIEVTVSGETVQAAENKALHPQDIIARLSKMGDTTFSVDFQNNIIDEETYISIGGLNKLRREATDLLKEKITDSYKRSDIKANIDTEVDTKASNSLKKYLTVLVKNKEQFKGVLIEGVKRIYFELSEDFISNVDYYADKCREYDIKLFVALPSIHYCDNIELLESLNFDGYLIRTHGQLLQLKNTKKLKALDYKFNVMNELSQNFLENFSDSVAISTELSFNELNLFANEKSEIVVYGRLPLMTTQACPIGMYAADKSEGKFCKLRNNTAEFSLKDRTNTNFPIITDCNSCMSYIYNSRPIFILHKFGDILNSPASFLRLEFTIENYTDVTEIICGYADRLMDDDDWAVKMLLDKLDKNFTNGHFYRH